MASSAERSEKVLTVERLVENIRNRRQDTQSLYTHAETTEISDLNAVALEISSLLSLIINPSLSGDLFKSHICSSAAPMFTSSSVLPIP